MKYKRFFLISIVLLIGVSEGNGRKCKVPQGRRCSQPPEPQPPAPQPPAPQPPKPQPPAPQPPEPPEPQLPEHVTPVPLLPCRQRKKQCGMFPQKCRKLAKPRFASMRCWKSPSEKKCTAKCFGHRVFRGTQVKKMTLTCTSFNFKPRNKFPDCVGQKNWQLTRPRPQVPLPQAPLPPEPELPEHVTPVPLLPRRQRKKQCGMFPQQCPTLAFPRFAHIRCKTSPSMKQCTAECTGHHVFKGTQLKKMTLTCTSYNFYPRREFPDCVRNEKCRLKLVGPGKIKCRSHFNSIECQIICGNRNECSHTCNKDGNWSPSLPSCVKPSGLQKVKRKGPTQAPKPKTPKPQTRKPQTPKPQTRKPQTPKPQTRKPKTPKPKTPKPPKPVTQFPLLPPQQRKKQCPTPKPPRFAAMACWKSPIEKKCTAKCIEHHVFRGTRLKEMTLICKSNNFQPRNQFPDCVRLQKVKRKGPTQAPKPKTPKPQTRKPQTPKPQTPKPQTPKPKPPKPKTPKSPKPVTQFPFLPRQQHKKQCPTPKPPRFAAMACWKSPIEKKCTAKCIEHHVFRGTRLKEMTLICKSNNFQPRNQFPDCVRSQQQVQPPKPRKPKTPKPKTPKPKPRKPKTTKPPKPQFRKLVTPVPCQQRKKQCRMLPQQCPTLIQPRFAAMRCRKSPSGKKCTAECVGHHIFKGTQLKKMTLTCRSNNFQPRKKFPECVRNGKCRLTLCAPGKIKCRSHFNTIECEIVCGSRNKGPFTCKKDGSWTPSLPRCVKQLGDPEFIKNRPKGYQTWDQKQWATRQRDHDSSPPFY